MHLGLKYYLLSRYPGNDHTSSSARTHNGPANTSEKRTTLPSTTWDPTPETSLPLPRSQGPIGTKRTKTERAERQGCPSPRHRQQPTEGLSSRDGTSVSGQKSPHQKEGLAIMYRYILASLIAVDGFRVTRAVRGSVETRHDLPTQNSSCSHTVRDSGQTNSFARVCRV